MQNRFEKYRTAPAAPGIVQLPPDPLELAREQRAGRSEQRQDRNAGISAEAAARAARNEGRLIDNDAANRRDKGIDRAIDFRRQFNAEKTVQEYQIGIASLGASLSRAPDSAGDIALIYDFAKAQDPGSVVREAEMGMAENTSPKIEAIAAQAKKQFGIDGGGNLTDEARRRLRREIANKVTAQNKAYSAVRGRYARDAQQFGLPVEQVIGPHAGDAFMPQIKEYAKAAGVPDGPVRRALSSEPNRELAAPGSKSRQEFDPKASAYLDQLVRKGVPYASAARQMGQKFNNTPIPDPRVYGEAVAYAKANPDYRGSYGYVERTVPLTSAEQFRNGVAQNPVTSALGLYANSAAAGIPQLLAGDRGTYGVESMRQATGGYGTAAEIAGFATGAVGADVGLRALAPSLGRFGQAILNNPGARTAATDISLGSMYGANTNPEDRVQGALMGGGAAAAGNLAGRYLLAPAATRAVDASRGLFGGRLRGVPEPLPSGERMLSNQFTGRRGVDPNEVTGRLTDAAGLNMPMSLADTDPALRALGGTVARKSPDALRLAEEAFRPRSLGQGERAIAAINQNLAPVGNIRQITDDAVSRARVAAQPLYESAYATTVPDTPALSELLSRPAGRTALGRARTIAANEGRDPTELGFALDEAGNVVLKQAQPELFGQQASAQTAVQEAQSAYRKARRTSNGDVEGARENLMQARENLRSANSTLAARPMAGTAETRPVYSTQTLDYVKRGLDDLLEEQRNPVTGALQLDEYGRSINQVRSGLISELNNLNPTYRQARDAYGQIADQGSAAQLGYDLAGSSKSTPADVATAFGRQRNESAPFFQRGYATNMADTVERSRLSGNPYNAINGSMGQRAKLSQVFPEGAPTFGRIAGMEDDMARTATEVLGGSATAPRLAADQAFDTNAVSNGAFDLGVSAVTGVPPVQLAAQGVKGVRDRFRNRMSEDQATQLAPILYNTNPEEAAAILQELIASSTRRRAYEGNARRVGGMFGGAFAAPLPFTGGQ